MRSILDSSQLASGLFIRACVYSTGSFFYMRISTSLFLLFAGLFFPPKFLPSDSATLTTLQSIENQGIFSTLFIAPWYRWDTIHFLEISDQGYLSNLQNTVWPPLFSFLVRGIGRRLIINSYWLVLQDISYPFFQYLSR